MSVGTDVPSRRRVGGPVVVVAAGLLTLTACNGVGTSPTGLDAGFVATVHSDGHAAGIVDGDATLVGAAHKICRRRDPYTPPAERRRAALTQREIDVVDRTFAGDARRFTALALDTYCP